MAGISWSRVVQKYVIFAAFCFFGFWLYIGGHESLTLPSFSTGHSGSSNPYQAAVRDAAIRSWKGYRKYGWGSDIYHPISHKGENMVGQPMGWIIVDSLDTLMLMGLDEYVAESREWIANTLDYDHDESVSVFETTIRMVGGLLSAYYLSKDEMYLSKAKDLADRILPAFDSPSGIPFAMVNLRRGVDHNQYTGPSSTAEVATLQLEFKYLAQLTGDERYWRAAEKVIEKIEQIHPEAGLAPIMLSPNDAHFTTSEIRLGSRGDSYYEYLIKQYLQTNKSEKVYQSMYDETVDGVDEHLVATSEPNKLRFIGELNHGVGGTLSNKMDHLVCFAGAMFAIGATDGKSLAAAKKLGWTKRQERDFALAEDITEACVHMYIDTVTGVAPEIVVFNTDPKSKEDYSIKRTDTHNLQRPETVESLFVLWRLTGNQKYRDWGWQIFQAWEKYGRLPGEQGYTALKDVTDVNGERIDNMESFWMAETLKYLYLLFDDDNTWPLDEIVFNTEAHPLPVFEPRFKTGWKRQHPYNSHA